MEVSEIEKLKAFVKDLTVYNDWLVGEMQHRVRNNLQMINSLINSQLSYMGDHGSRKALLDSRRRLFAISLVYQKMYGPALVSMVELGVYIRELVDYLMDEYDIKKRVRLELDMERVELDVAMAVPLGQMLNELICNSLKFAFPDGRDGVVHITLKRLDTNALRLVFSDNGIGLREDFDLRKEKSLGSTLIFGLARQIKADIAIRSREGLTFVIDFDPKKFEERFWPKVKAD